MIRYRPSRNTDNFTTTPRALRAYPSGRVIDLADRYAGRHIRQARHGAWVNKKRSRVKSTRNALPAAAAFTVAGILIGGTGAAMQLSASGAAEGDLASGYDAADYPPPDRDALLNRASRDDTRTTATTMPTKQSGNAAVMATGSCVASYHVEAQRTASGEISDPTTLTAAHQSLPFNSRVRVTNVNNGKSVIVRINDRGPFVDGRCLDLSQTAFKAIASLGAGIVDVRYEVLIEDAT